MVHASLSNELLWYRQWPSCRLSNTVLLNELVRKQQRESVLCSVSLANHGQSNPHNVPPEVEHLCIPMAALAPRFL